MVNQPLGWLAAVSVSRPQPGGGVAVLAGQATVVAMVLDMGVSRDVGGVAEDGADALTGGNHLVKVVVRLGVGVRLAPSTGAHLASARTSPARVARRPHFVVPQSPYTPQAVRAATPSTRDSRVLQDRRDEGSARAR